MRYRPGKGCFETNGGTTVLFSDGALDLLGPYPGCDWDILYDRISPRLGISLSLPTLVMPPMYSGICNRGAAPKMNACGKPVARHLFCSKKCWALDMVVAFGEGYARDARKRTCSRARYRMSRRRSILKTLRETIIPEIAAEELRAFDKYRVNRGRPLARKCI